MYSSVFMMMKMVDFVKNYFPVFMLGAIFDYPAGRDRADAPAIL